MLPEDVRALALMLPEVIEGAHMGNADFRVGGRIFATLWSEEERTVLKLTPGHQAVLIEAEPALFAPLPGAWGRRGWTNLDLPEADEEVLRGALLNAWRATAPPALVAAYDPA
ncbi:MmcQ/YjbR family DNA-binding protein [Methylobacterium planeticum]|uniref:MmcQ/YjbR family DNA-binding protein n=1 Tax=Methylobacterium planeticum TaxID=2615211 RepID=A0A6N6MV25_9HYPH|nr:MmcQ/YjbR family DNA-binding protein [Methylobacterium planeticum]KAB1074708.1 MmcQ/YjbR family DNA-binding protein [Methylobacterium planeticum]